MFNKLLNVDNTKKCLNILFAALITITFIYVLITYIFFQDYLLPLSLYIAIIGILFSIIFKTFRSYIKNQATLKENEKHIRKLEGFTKKLLKQRKNIEKMLEDKTKLSDQLLEQNKQLQRAKKMISKEKEKFAALFEATQVMSSSLDLEHILPDILRLVNTLVDFKSGRVLLPQEDCLKVKYKFGYDPKRSKVTEIKWGEGITGNSAANREIILVEDVRKDERYISELPETQAELALPLIFQGELLGVLDIQDDKPFTWLDEQEDILDILVLFSNFAAVVIHNSNTFSKLKESYVSTIKALARAIDAKDPYTHGHCERVKNLSLEIGKNLGLDPMDLEELEFAALLHDIGKIGLPEAILLKPGRLSPVEFEVIKSHPKIGADMVGDISFLQRTRRIIEQHHERIDGTGYPNGLHGEQIDFLAKIITVADAIDAMLTKRPYRDPQNIKYVLRELENCQGKQFDLLVTEVAKEIVAEELEIINLA